jgi:hypothetical protein
MGFGVSKTPIRISASGGLRRLRRRGLRPLAALRARGVGVAPGRMFRNVDRRLLKYHTHRACALSHIDLQSRLQLCVDPVLASGSHLP